MRFNNNPIGSAFFWFFAFLLAAELAAHVALPYSSHPSAGTVYRNPTDRRAWPEFTGDNGASDKKLVVIISGSQGVGKEMHDAEKIYFAMLKKEIEKGNPSVSLENWSSGGIRTVDIDLLALRALERKADLVVFVLSCKNFDSPSILNLSYPQADINLLAGRPFTWKYLRHTVFYPNTTYHDIIKRYSMLNSSLLRSRTEVLDSLARMTPQELHINVFGHVIGPGARLDIYRPKGPITPPKREDYHTDGKKLKELTDRENMTKRLQTFRKFYRNNSKRFSDSKIRSVWVWLPIARDIFAEETIDNIDFFNREASEIIMGSGVDVVDLTWNIPTERFLTRVHFDEKGHELMADLMLPVVRHELQ